MNQGSFDKVRQIAADIFTLDVEQVTASSSPESIEAWDSMQHLNLVLALEQSFDVTFAPEEIETMVTIGEIVNVLRKKGARARPAS